VRHLARRRACLTPAASDTRIGMKHPRYSFGLKTPANGAASLTAALLGPPTRFSIDRLHTAAPQQLQIP